MKPVVLILGATGFLGTYLMKYLQDSCTVLGTSRTGRPGFVVFQPETDSLRKVVADHRVDVVVNAIVAYNEDAHLVNSALLSRLVNELSHTAIHFLAISTIFATEENKAINDYSRSKFAGEKLVEDGLQGHYCIVRLPQVVDKARRAYQTQKGFYYIMDEILGNKIVSLPANFEERRAYLDIDQVTTVLGLLIHNAIKGVVNILPSDTYNLKELGALIAELSGNVYRSELSSALTMAYKIPSPGFEHPNLHADQLSFRNYLKSYF